MKTLRVVPSLDTHQVHAAALTDEHRNRMVTLRGKDGTSITAILEYAAASMTPGFTVLRMSLVGTTMTLAVPDLAPVRVHPEETHDPRT